MSALKLAKEEKEELIVRIQEYAELQLGETLGHLAAENLLSFVLEEVGPYVYNQAIQDARAALREQVEKLNEELYALSRPLPRHR